MKKHQWNEFRTWIEIDSRSLFFNLGLFARKARPARIMGVIKSNAYGHGLSLIARLLANSKSQVPNSKALWFGVDSIVEALRLRRDGIKNQILVLGYTLPGRYSDAARENITITISHFEGLEALARAKRKPSFHLKFDTGMHRHGFQEFELAELIKNIKKYRLEPTGAFSHLSVADNREYSKKQIAVFDHCISALRAAGIRVPLIHLNKTEGIINFPRRDAIARLGIGLYGYLPQGRKGSVIEKFRKKLKPILTWKTVVSEVKRVKKGEYIGYDLTYGFPHDATIAILPIGYWHGYDRGFSNTVDVLIHGKRAAVRGRVCMDITMVEVTGISNVKIGDEAVLIGKQGRESISADELAGKINTTAYEVLTRLNPLIRRDGQ